MTRLSVDPDVALVQAALAVPPETQSVAGFVPGPGISKLQMRFDIAALRQALDICPPMGRSILPIRGAIIPRSMAAGRSGCISWRHW